MLNAQLNSVVKIVNDLQGVDNFEQFENEVISSIENLFGASDTLIFDWTHFFQGSKSFHQDDMFFHHHDIPIGWDYPRFKNQDPLYEWVVSGRCHNDANVTRLSDLVSFQDIKNSEFNKEILEPMDCRYIMTLAAHHGESMVLSLSLIRSSRGRDFSKSDVLAAQILTPVLASAYANFVLRSEASEKDDVFDIMTKRYPDEAFVVFSKDLRGIYRSKKMTALGRRLIKYGNDIREIFNKSPRLEGYLSVFLSSQKSNRRRLPLSIVDSVKINSKFFLKVKMQSFFYGEGKRYLLAEVTVEKAARNCLERDFGLTAREYQIAQLAATGLSNREIGEQLVISPWSVKNHLQNIYKKVGVNSRVQLSQLIHQGLSV